VIIVTRLNGSRFAVNPDLIERIHANPDTTLVLVDGSSYIVTERVDEIIDLIARYRAKVIALAHQGATQPATGPVERSAEVVPLAAPRGKGR
jgi:flagellar protein FlbD